VTGPEDWTGCLQKDNPSYHITAEMRGSYTKIDTAKISFLRKSFVSAKHLRENAAHFAKNLQRDQYVSLAILSKNAFF
jgi:hypothetical protein